MNVSAFLIIIVHDGSVVQDIVLCLILNMFCLEPFSR